MKIENTWFLVNLGNQCFQYCIQISTLSSLAHLTDQPGCKKGRLAKVKDGIRNLILCNYLIDRYRVWLFGFWSVGIRSLGI